MVADIIIVAVIIVIGIAVFVIYKILSKRTTITVNTKSITIPLYGTGTITAEMWYKPWFTKKRTQGTMTIGIVPGGRSIVSVAPAQASTSHTSSAQFTVTGTSAGMTFVTINGTSRHGAHSTEEIQVTVTGGS